MLQPFERLKRVFGGHVDRLMRRFGISEGLAYKWMRDSADLGTGTPNPLQRGRDLIDEALIVDSTGKGAWLIASDGVEYCASLLASRVGSFSQKSEVKTVISKSADLVCSLNDKDIAEMSAGERKEVAEHVSDLDCALERIKALLNSRRETAARSFQEPRDVRRVGSGD
jgi:hypothetical protein